MGTKSIFTKDGLIKFFESQNDIDILQLYVSNEGEVTQEGLDIIEYITQNANNLSKDIKKIIINLPYESLPKNVFLKVCEMYKNLGDNVIVEASVNHSYSDKDYYDQHIVNWNIKTIIKANTEIDKVCDFIRQNNFSQFEALAYIHSYVATIARYNESGHMHDWYIKDQLFPGAFLDMPEVVCAGYSALMKEIIDNLNMPGLECETLTVQFDHMDEWYTARHSRCFIKIKDEKYGLDQTLFDDPTWDNDKELKVVYAHFAMPNNSFDLNVSKMYDYRIPRKVVRNKKYARVSYSQNNLLDETYDNSERKINQLMIEAAYFEVGQKVYPNKSLNELYAMLGNVAKASYEEQESRKYVGNLTSPNLKLTKMQAKKIFDNGKINNNNSKNNNENEINL